MVYNAMKLFMEVNPQLFDDCSHDYAESQNNAGQRQQSRQDRWDKLAKLAEARQNGAIEKPAVSVERGSFANEVRRLGSIKPGKTGESKVAR